MRKVKGGKTEVDFLVTSMKPVDFYTKALRFFDLFGENDQVMAKMTETMTVTWKRGHKVTKARIEKTRKKLIEAMEEYGCVVESVIVLEN